MFSENHDSYTPDPYITLKEGSLETTRKETKAERVNDRKKRGWELEGKTVKRNLTWKHWPIDAFTTSP